MDEPVEHLRGRLHDLVLLVRERICSNQSGRLTLHNKTRVASRGDSPRGMSMSRIMSSANS